MIYEICPLELKPCTCDAEGEVQVKMPDGSSGWLYYQGSDEQAEIGFPIGHDMKVSIVGKLCFATAVAGSDAFLALSPINCTFTARGPVTRIREIDDEILYTIGLTTPIEVCIERGETAPFVGQWLDLSGELWVNPDGEP
jgi:hypothetical protein